MPMSPDPSGLPSPLIRTLAIVKALDPTRLTQVIFDFLSILRSQFWDGKRSGPDFIYPMTSLTKRQSGHLAKLVHQHSKTLPNLERRGTDASWQRDFSQAVAILDLCEVSDHPLESQYTTPADIDLMVLVPILLNLIVSLKTVSSLSFAFIIMDIVWVLIVGPGTLKLIRRSSAHPTELDPGSGCAVLLDDDLTVVIQGSQEVVEAITEGGFYLSVWDFERQSPAEGQQTKVSLSERRTLELARPVKDIDVCGVLDTLIPNERDIWRAWKKRVSDRIVHETDTDFAPTIPTFPDSERQKRLKLLLDEAQSAYETYTRLPPRRRESVPVSGKVLS